MPLLKIDEQDVPWAALGTRLGQRFANRSENVVMVEPDGILPYAKVVELIDVCRGTGAKVYLATPAIAAESEIGGTWRGKLHDLPAMVLTVKDEGGKVSGTLLLYFVHRDTEDGAWQMDTKRSVLLPLLNTKVEQPPHPFYGKVALFFRVSHNEALPPSGLCGPHLVSFQLVPRAKDRADLVSLCVHEGPGRKMVRDEK